MSTQDDQKTGVVMFVMNDLLNDPRVQREARSAVRAGFIVTVVATQSNRCRIAEQELDGYEVRRVVVPSFRLTYTIFKVWRFLVMLTLILKEGGNLAFGLPPGPEAPGQDPSPPSRLRRIKWMLMQGTALILKLARPWRKAWQRMGLLPPDGISAEQFWAGAAQGFQKRVYEIGFFEEALWTSLAMRKAARLPRARVFHANDVPMLPVALWAAWRLRGKTVYDSHELWVGMNPENTPLFDRISRWIESWAIRRVDAVVTVNDLIAEELRRQYGIPLPIVVMNCPEPSPPRPVPVAYSIRTRLGLDADVPLILYQGLYMPGRGLEELIESARHLARGVIVLRGYGSHEPELRRKLAESRLEGRVFMVEPVPMADMVNAAAEADVGVVPYSPCTRGYYYASPNKLFEYILAGLAIAVSNLPVLEKIVRDHDLGVVFDPADPKHIAEQLNALVGNPARLRACRANASRVGRERYHWDREGGKLIELYKTLAVAKVRRGAG